MTKAQDNRLSVILLVALVGAALFGASAIALGVAIHRLGFGMLAFAALVCCLMSGMLLVSASVALRQMWQEIEP